jgi:peptidoglycan/LPS O-acetylase OafA/YrhL
VLSGYVLTLPTLQGRQPTYLRYAFKRFCRIYLPYAASAAGAMLGASLLWRRATPAMSEWFQTSWTAPVSRASLLAHALLVLPFKTGDFNNVIWSLVHEMRVSLVFPVLAAFAVREKWGWSLAGAACLSLAGCVVPQLHWRLRFLTDYGLSAHYAAMFLLGALLAKHRAAIAARLKTLPTAGWTILLAAGIALYGSEGLSPAARLAQNHPFEWLTAAGAAVLIACAASTAWLRAPALLWLGRISYSLYLWHLPVMLAVIRVGSGHLPLWVLSSSSLLLGLITADVMHRLIEAPSLRLARQWTRNSPSPA